MTDIAQGALAAFVVGHLGVRWGALTATASAIAFLTQVLLSTMLVSSHHWHTLAASRVFSARNAMHACTQALSSQTGGHWLRRRLMWFGVGLLALPPEAVPEALLVNAASAAGAHRCRRRRRWSGQVVTHYRESAEFELETSRIKDLAERVNISDAG